MMHAVIIGGSGHVGTYLVPMLVEAGYQVTNVSRSQRNPYQSHKAWESVAQVTIDRTQAEAEGTFGRQIRELEPDVLIDMICFTEESCIQLVEALRGQVQHFLHCSTIWVYGHSTVVPTTEDQPRYPFGDYGINKAKIEADLRKEARANGFPVTNLLPGHIVGPGWEPLNPAGHFNMKVFEQLARGKEVVLPNLGMETVHHVHAEDVAQAFMKAIANWSVAVGESYHAVSPAAVTLRGYAEAVASWFGQEPNLRFVPWEEFRQAVSPQEAEATWDHIAHSPNASIEKARRHLGYAPRYTSLQAVYESVMWLADQGRITL
jgi:nucleoside-diphosphate-sugar epimerase